jgi:hypothetical protein
MALRSRHERRAGQFQRSSDGAVAGETRPDAESQASGARTAADARRPAARYSVGMGTLRNVPALCAVRVRRRRDPVGR